MCTLFAILIASALKLTAVAWSLAGFGSKIKLQNLCPLWDKEPPTSTYVKISHFWPVLAPKGAIKIRDQEVPEPLFKTSQKLISDQKWPKLDQPYLGCLSRFGLFGRDTWRSGQVTPKSPLFEPHPRDPPVFSRLFTGHSQVHPFSPFEPVTHHPGISKPSAKRSQPH